MGRRKYVLIVDDCQQDRMAVADVLRSDYDILEACNGKQALEILSRKRAQISLIMLDLMMPVMNGVETTRAVLSEFPGLKIVILTSFLEDDLVVDAIEAGAVSYVLKTVSAEELIYALQGAFRGMPVMTGDVSQALTRGIRQRTVQGDSSGLTEREKEVLLLIAEGKTNKDIGEELHISIKTVKTHVSNLLMKCELDDRTQLAIYAHRKGWAQG